MRKQSEMLMNTTSSSPIPADGNKPIFFLISRPKLTYDTEFIFQYLFSTFRLKTANRV